MDLTNEDLWRVSPLIWAHDNKLQNEKGKPLEFKDHAFLKAPFDDFSTLQTYRKASQVGFSTMMILKAFNAAKYKGWNIIYTLPTGGDVLNFVGSKVNPIIQCNPLLQAWTKDKDTIEQKKVGKSFIYYRGTVTSKSERDKSEGGAGIMLSSDWNVHDECDRSDQVSLEQYESREAASPYKGKCYFSNPSNPHTLSQKLYDRSDQKHWFVRCSRCKFRQYLDFFVNIRDGNFVCSQCGGVLSDDDRRQGEWIQKYRNREVSGYWISHLMCPWITAAEIGKAYETNSRAYFYNFVLGLPYRGSDVYVDRDMILRNVSRKMNEQQHVVLGVDQGFKKHWVLMNHTGVFRIGVTEDWREIERLIKEYDVECAVFDALPDLTEPRKIRDRFPGIVWLNYFKKEIKKADFITWDTESRTVYSDRTKMIQQAIDKFVSRELRIQIDPRELDTYIQHWGSLYKVIESDNLGIERDVWETSGEDHYCFAQIYALLALSRVSGEGTGIKKWSKAELPFTNKAPDIAKIIKDNEQWQTNTNN